MIGGGYTEHPEYGIKDTRTPQDYHMNLAAKWDDICDSDFEIDWEIEKKRKMGKGFPAELPY